MKIVTLKGIRVQVVPDSPGRTCGLCVFYAGHVPQCPEFKEEESVVGVGCAFGEHHYVKVDDVH